MTRETIIAWVREHSGCTTAQVADALDISTHVANAHLTRAASEPDPRIVQAAHRRPYTWHAVVSLAPAAPVDGAGAEARLAEIAARHAALDREERAVRAFLAAWHAS